MRYHGKILLVMACLSLIFSGCGSSYPALNECAGYTAVGSLAGGAAGYAGAESVSGDSTSSTERAVSTAVAAAAGATAGYALCVRVWRQKKELEERFEALEAQVGREEEQKQSTEAVDEDSTEQPITDPASQPVHGGDEEEKVVDSIGVIENRAVRLALNSSLMFESGEATLQPSTYSYLDVLALSLEENADSEVTIVGHTDNEGSEELNLRLSKERAQTVASYLVKNGISEERLETVGVGESEPIADNTTPEGRAKNRRVEIVIVPVGVSA